MPRLPIGQASSQGSPEIVGPCPDRFSGLRNLSLDARPLQFGRLARLRSETRGYQSRGINSSYFDLGTLDPSRLDGVGRCDPIGEWK
jgi:hypothetical protein